MCLEIVDLIEDESRSNLGLNNDGKGAMLRNRLETYNAINSNIIHHPSPTTVAIVPSQILNTKEHNNIMNRHLQSTTKAVVKESKPVNAPLNTPDSPNDESRIKQIKISYPAPSTSSSFTLQHPPPLPSPIYQSPSSQASATPPPPPPDTPSSSFSYAMPDTPSYAPPAPPDTPDSCASTPAPPPPPSPSVSDKHLYHNGYVCSPLLCSARQFSLLPSRFSFLF